MGLSKKELAKILREAREKKGLTQADVAKKAKLNTNYYAVIERGEVNPSLETLSKILEALNIKLTLP
ncbi:MAG: helix-turn-helix transcriptional regulator [Candidatus Levybacteria bacterium]|nr:helix-turn-helix transcriptional regulator [Candidatus Levybacteria bacterium]